MAHLLELEGLLDPGQAAAIASRLATAPFGDGRATAHGPARGAKHNEQLDREHPVSQELGATVLAALSQSPVFRAAAMPHTILPVCFARYLPGMEYGTHLDRPVLVTPGGPVRTDLSVTVWLNGPDAYDGGELVVSTPGGERRLRGRAGDAVVYPSDTLHRVTPVTRGERLVAITWLQSLVPSAEQRQILFDLAMLATRLAAIGTEDDVLAAHHVHHRLTRMWSR
ncbi:MAG: Fe2+-dependent dioxygenase [Alphaproteobacteria bacterium]|nr:Fe2+-dependent dioxygenase [Alphaproteobacteria bacterium]